MERKQIEEYSLAGLLRLVQDNILDGWRVDFDTNEGYPQSYGSHLTCGMVLVPSKSESIEIVIPVPEPKPVVENTEVVKVVDLVSTQSNISAVVETPVLTETQQAMVDKPIGPENQITTEVKKPGRPRKEA